MSIFPNQFFTEENIKARWEERYTSEAINKKFLGIPRGVYAGFIPGLDVNPNKLNLDVDPSEGISLVRVESGQEKVMVDIITDQRVQLDFTGHSDWPVYVIAKSNYVVGQTTSGQIITRKTAAAGATEVNICKIDRPGNQGSLVISPSTTFPTNDIISRQEPYAFAGQRFGFMPDGSYEDLQDAILTTNEVVASRQDLEGTVAPNFDNLLPQTTGVPQRLKNDLSAASMARRLGKRIVSFRGNTFTTASPATQVNISGSFSAQARTSDPYRDVSTGALAPGALTALVGNGSENVNFNLTAILGTFTVGSYVTGNNSGATAIIRAVNSPVITVNDIQGTFHPGETITGSSSGPPTGILSSINYLEGAVTSEEGGGAGDNIRNVVFLVNNTSNKRPLDSNGNVIFGRLRYGPPGGGPVFNSGQITLTGSLFFTNLSTSVTGVGTNFTNEVAVGDIIEGADGRFYEVSLVGGATSLTIATPYSGLSASSGTRRRRRFLMDLLVNNGTTEVAPIGSLPAGTYRPYFGVWLNEERSNADTELTRMVPGEPPAGIRVQNTGSAGGTTISPGSTSGFEGVINFIPGTNMALTIAEDTATGKVNVTITNTFVGGAAFPGFDSSTPQPDSGAGSAGSGGAASHGDHVHPLSSAYRSSSFDVRAEVKTATGVSGSATISFSFTPKGIVFISAFGSQACVAVASGNGAGDQVVVGTPATTFQTGRIYKDAGGNEFSVSAFGSSTTITQNAGAGTPDFAALGIGSS